MNKLGFFDLSLANKVGYVLGILNTKYNFDAYEIIERFTSSNLFEHIIDWDVAVVSQSKYYIADLFLEEFEKDLPMKNSINNSDALFWYGYLITRWCIQEQIYGKDISENYNIISILQSYDVLHSLSIDNAIDHIKLDDRLENIERS